MSATDTSSPAAAEAGAEEARANLVGTLNQLRENLKPANVANEVMTNAKVSASAVTDQVWDAARRNPLPALMIGAGVAMLLGLGGRSAVGRASSSGVGLPRTGTFAPIRSRDPLAVAQPDDPTRPASPTRWSTTSPAKPGSAQDRTADLLGTANTRLADAAARGAASVRSTIDQAKSGADPMSYIPHSTQQARTSLSRLIDDQPLVLAAIGVAIGAAIGAAIPQTETENRFMGDASHSVRDAARGAAEQQVGQIRSAAQHAVEDIKQSAADHGLNSDNLSGLAHDVGEHAKAATQEASKGLPTT